jgi:hypothetical protein
VRRERLWRSASWARCATDRPPRWRRSHPMTAVCWPPRPLSARRWSPRR